MFNPKILFFLRPIKTPFMAYRYPSVLPGGGCSDGACSGKSRPCTPNKKIINTLTLDFSNDPNLTGRYVVQTGTTGFFFVNIVPTGYAGIAPTQSFIPETANLLAAEYYSSSTPKTTSGALFSASVYDGASGVPAGSVPIQIQVPSGAFAAAQRTNGPTGTFVVYYI
jgi:hypothetical protein